MTPPAASSSNRKSAATSRALAPRSDSEKNTSSRGGKKVSELLNEQVAATALLIIAPDRVRRERAAQHMIQVWGSAVSKVDQPSSPRAVAAHRYCGSELSPSEISRLADAAVSLDLFTPFQISYVRDVHICSVTIARELCGICEKFSASHRILLTAQELPAKHPLRDFFSARHALLEFEALRGFELQRWLERELRRLGIQECSEEALASLIAAGEEDVDRLVSMAEQLACFSDRKVLALQDIESLFIHHAIPGEFDFLDALASKNIVRAELMMSDIINSGKNPFMLLALIHRSFSNYLAIRMMLDEGEDAQHIRQKLKISPWVYNKAVVAIKKFSANALVSAMQSLVALDSKMKNRSLGPALLISETIAELCAQLPQKPGLATERNNP